jgi:hypothetical protein
VSEQVVLLVARILDLAVLLLPRHTITILWRKFDSVFPHSTRRRRRRQMRQMRRSRRRQKRQMRHSRWRQKRRSRRRQKRRSRRRRCRRVGPEEEEEAEESFRKKIGDLKIAKPHTVGVFLSSSNNKPKKSVFFIQQQQQTKKVGVFYPAATTNKNSRCFLSRSNNKPKQSVFFIQQQQQTKKVGVFSSYLVSMLSRSLYVFIHVCLSIRVTNGFWATFFHNMHQLFTSYYMHQLYN